MSFLNNLSVSFPMLIAFCRHICLRILTKIRYFECFKMCLRCIDGETRTSYLFSGSFNDSVLNNGVVFINSTRTISVR